MSRRPRTLPALVGAAALVGSVLVPATVALADPASSGTTHQTVYQMTDPIYRVTHANGNSVLTPWEGEARNAVENLGWEGYEIAFYASARETDFTEPVYRLYNPRTNSFLQTVSARERANAERQGFVFEHISFYVPAWDMRGTEQVHRMDREVGGVQRYMDVAGWDEVEKAAHEGWHYAGHSYRAMSSVLERPGTPAPEPAPTPTPTPAPPPTPTPPPAPAPDTGREGDGEFTFIHINDTQEDVFPDSRHRFESRVQWILDNKDAEDIRFVGHTGDVVNWWETATNNLQYQIAGEVLAPLIASDVPLGIAVGNHDTLAVADGAGSANLDDNGRSLAAWGVRQTELLNQTFPSSSFKALAGEMEPGKLDNSFHTFRAEGADFLVLSLELWPRREALDWAKDVVRTHPDHNVIVLTHVYLWPSGDVVSNPEYGSLPPTVIADELVYQYPNVKMVLSGHVGDTTQRVQTGRSGNKILASLTNMSPSPYGPVRSFRIDVANNRVDTDIVRTHQGGSRGHHSMSTEIEWIK